MAVSSHVAEDPNPEIETGEIEPPVQPIGRTVVRGAGMLTLLRLGTGSLSLVVRLVILANLLGPDQIGLFGAALLVLGILEVFSQTGFEHALIQRPGRIDEHLDTAFSTHLVRGVALATILYLGAPAIVHFFRDPVGLLAPLQVLAIVPLITGCRNMAVTQFSRNLQFRPMVILNGISPVVELVVSVIHAAVFPSVWALVSGRIAGTTAMVAYSYFAIPQRPRLNFSLARFRELHSFGAWVFLSNILAFALFKGGDLAVGAMLPMAVLGVYTFADTIACRPTVDLTKVLNQVTFLAYSRIHSDKPRLRRAFYKSYSRTCAFVFLLTALLVAGAPDFIHGFFGAEWGAAAPLIQILAVWGASRALGAVSSSLFLAAGRPALATIYQGVMLALFFAAIIPAIRLFGATGVAATLAVIGSVVQVARTQLIGRVLDEWPWKAYLILLATASTGAIAVTGTLAIRHLFGNLHVIVALLYVGLSTFSLYSLVLFAWDRVTSGELQLVPDPRQLRQLIGRNVAERQG